MNRQASKQPIGITAEVVFSSWLDQLESAPQLLVGFSGGLDSTVLLHLLCELLPPERVTALHIHHGLSDNADHWQQHAKDLSSRAMWLQLICKVSRENPCTPTSLLMQTTSVQILMICPC